MDTLAATSGDSLADLIRDSRGLSPEQNDLREEWYSALDHVDKESLLFELEMLLKGVACFSKTTNHPGARRYHRPERRTYSRELRVVYLASERISDLCRKLIDSDVDTPDDQELIAAGSLEQLSSRLCDEPLKQERPEQSLQFLYRSFSDLADVVGVMSGFEPIPLRSFAGVTRMASREIGRNTFFDPLRLLEFRPEYDRLSQADLLDIVYREGPEGARKSVALSFLAFLRLLRYLDFADSFLNDDINAHLACIPLATLHGDGKALVEFLSKDAQRWLSGEFEEQVLNVGAQDVMILSEELEQHFYLLQELGTMFVNIGNQLDLELCQAFEQTLPSLHIHLHTEEFRDRTIKAIEDLREFLKSSVVTLAHLFEPQLEPERVFGDDLDRRSQSERLRRDIWIFSQILRAFLAKAAAAPEAINKWSGNASYLFVKDFLRYFKSRGYHLLRTTEYWRFDEFMSFVEALSSADVLERELVDVFITECELFREFLGDAFAAVNARIELQGVDFDRRGAAATLQIYLQRD